MRTKAPECCQNQHECNAQFLFVDTIEDGGENICKKSLNSIQSHLSSTSTGCWIHNYNLNLPIINAIPCGDDVADAMPHG